MSINRLFARQRKSEELEPHFYRKKNLNRRKSVLMRMDSRKHAEISFEDIIKCKQELEMVENATRFVKETLGWGVEPRLPEPSELPRGVPGDEEPQVEAENQFLFSIKFQKSPTKNTSSIGGQSIGTCTARESILKPIDSKQKNRFSHVGPLRESLKEPHNQLHTQLVERKSMFSKHSTTIRTDRDPAHKLFLPPLKSMHEEQNSRKAGTSILDQSMLIPLIDQLKQGAPILIKNKARSKEKEGGGKGKGNRTRMI